MQTVPTSLRDATTRCYWQQTLGSPGYWTPTLIPPLGKVTVHMTGVCVLVQRWEGRGVGGGKLTAHNRCVCVGAGGGEGKGS